MTVIPGTDLDAAAPAGGTALEQFEQRFRLSAALSERGVELNTLSPDELSDLEALARARLSPALDALADHWQQEHATLSELEQIERELRRRILDDGDAMAHYYNGCECEACGYRHYEHTLFVDFRGLLLCDGCAANARDLLRELQQPLVERLATDPTLENALALGYKLIRHNGRLTWVSDDDDYDDGGSRPYADEHEALQRLIDQLR